MTNRKRRRPAPAQAGLGIGNPDAHGMASPKSGGRTGMRKSGSGSSPDKSQFRGGFAKAPNHIQRLKGG